MKSAMRFRSASSGSRPSPAPMLSLRWSGSEVAGMGTVTAGLPSNHFRKNWAQDVAPNSLAHSGTGRSPTRLKSRVRPKGPLMRVAMPRSRTMGRIVSSTFRLSMA